jgi:predicted MPP superfamily phosphohydrolase
MSLPDAAAAAGSWSPFRWVVTVVVVLVATLIAWTIVEARSVQVSRATITSPNLPTEFDGKLVLFVADIHAGPYLGKRRMRAIVDRINALEPDIIVLGGDYVGGRAGGKAVFYPEIKHLNAPLGAYAVLGNHDYWEGVEEAKAGLAAAGVTLLLNDNVPLTLDGASIRLAGVDGGRRRHRA